MQALDLHVNRLKQPAPYRTLSRALRSFLSFDGFFQLVSLVQDPEELAEPPFTDEARPFLEKVIALYGADLSAAFFSDETLFGGHDWFSIIRDVYRDVETGDYRCLIHLTKRNGEVVRLEMLPSSLLRLISRLLAAASAFGDHEAFESRDVEALRRDMDRLLSVLDTGSAPAPSS